MSFKGGQNRNKHGCAHASTHGAHITTKNGIITLSFDDKSSYTESSDIEGSEEAIQDGVSGAVMAQSGQSLEEALAELSEAESSNSDGEDGTYETPVADSRPVWNSDKVISIGNLYTDHGLDLTTYKARQVGDLHDKRDSLLVDSSSVLLPAHKRLLTDGTAHSSPNSPTRPLVGRSRSYSDGEDRSGLNAQDRACLEEIEKGSQLSPEDKELLERKKQELQALEFKALDRSNTLMTPQELESMPEEGMEFEESVGPKQIKIPICASSLCDDSSSNPFDNIVSSITDGYPNEIENLSVTKLKGEDSEIQTLQSTSTSTTNQSEHPDSVSIFTEAGANSTQILVETDQGKQIYQINTSDLQLAQTADGSETVSVSLTGGAMGLDSEGNVVNTEITGITVQDGFLVIPVQNEEPSTFVFEPVDNMDSAISGQLNANVGDEVESTIDAGGRRIWVCPEQDCERTFHKASKLKTHLMTHTGERPYKCTVPGCDWAFTTCYRLRRHEKSHKKRKEFQCSFPNCGRQFTTVYNLKTHMRLHNRPNTQECTICGEKFPTMRKLDLHMKSHSDAPKTYQCPVEGCDKMFYSPHCMGSHTRVHQQDRDLTCKVTGCGKVFDKLCRLKQHMRSHTGEKPYVCGMQGCGWAFATASKLKRHQHKHTGYRKFVCPEEGCDKAFMRAEHLKGHLVTHRGDKPFECPIEGCDARFSAKSSIYVHIKKHSKPEKITYFCPIEGCNKKYTGRATLRKHIEQHYLMQAVDAGILTPLTSAGEVCLVPVMPLAATENQDAVTQAVTMAAAAAEQGAQVVAAADVDVPIMDVNASDLLGSEAPTHLITETGEAVSLSSLGMADLNSNLMAQLVAQGNLVATTGTTPASSAVVSVDTADQNLSGMVTLAMAPTLTQPDAGTLEVIPTSSGVQTVALTGVLPAGVTLQSQLGSPGLGTQLHEQLGSPGLGTAVSSLPSGVTLQTPGISLQSAGTRQGISLLNSRNLPEPLASIAPKPTTSTNGKQEKISTASMLGDLDVSSLLQLPDPTARSARTDVKGNQRLSKLAKQRAKKKQETSQQTKADSKLEPMLQIKSVTSLHQMKGETSLEKSDTSMSSDITWYSDLDTVVPPKTSAITAQTSSFTTASSDTSSSFSPSDLLTSQGITYRDPDTGAIYVQTQLLQDDPPNPEVFGDDPTLMDVTADQTTADTDLPLNILSDRDDSVAMEFTGTTINLQDLE